MSSYKEFLAEKQKIDELYKSGYEITKVEENLSGAFLTFERSNLNGKSKVTQVKLQILTADARKYFSNLIMAKQKNLV
ncbi:hypothetical protein [Bacillus badius]|uniref:Uncharacterized protein n=1 Tax=Bacillus badius TaxID=1455 RepID=A0ABR5AZR0_BACBA|nr:hypothetical protein [Bacillus badius]KIL73214.1 hypothetical protein SD78_3402 [Bacillus badius]KIL80226.1 hypothetical protein SD77_0074 [Bacillus badius]KZO00771.1 hypothetical protein A4244_02630 [Bacillus badius]KZR56847.1 hypothetical protein A3781_06220 [Bacillus badius]MED0666994.1 hypothetical protein [Bacillus badius]